MTVLSAVESHMDLKCRIHIADIFAILISQRLQLTLKSYEKQYEKPEKMYFEQ